MSRQGWPVRRRLRMACSSLDDLVKRTAAPAQMVFDLPAGGRRLVQRVDGYIATLVAGEHTFAACEPTGARPGRLVRGRVDRRQFAIGTCSHRMGSIVTIVTAPRRMLRARQRS